MCVGSWAAFYLFGKEREQGFGRKKGGDSNRRPGLRQVEEFSTARLRK
jgi:hypothetical protein